MDRQGRAMQTERPLGTTEAWLHPGAPIDGWTASRGIPIDLIERSKRLQAKNADRLLRNGYSLYPIGRIVED